MYNFGPVGFGSLCNIFNCSGVDSAARIGIVFGKVNSRISCAVYNYLDAVLA